MISSFNNKVLQWLAYPGVLALGLVLQATMLKSGIGLQWSSYVPITIGVILISILEWVIPFRKEWRPNFSEVRTDFLFTVVVQVLVPKVLTFLVAISLLQYVNENNLAVFSFWPHHWHISLQVVLMMTSAELMRYWLHRAAHNWSVLWRLHAVHHSPEKLYWINTSRFHPIEKSIQFLFDSLPFILLGVSTEVLAIYFVFYALNGFFQHSNVNLKMGWLNYVISSAQLHRWHHSKIIGESGTNYGNNLIIWDIIFGSWFLPKDREVKELGLFNRKYPMSFSKQMKAPFTSGIDKYPILLLSFKEVVQNLRIQLGIFWASIVYMAPFERSLSKPLRFQNKLLQKIIYDNRDTKYGRLHKFDKIHDHQSFVKNIEIQDYEDLRPFIKEQEETKTTCLTHEQPHYYAVTSGTTGEPKYIPVLDATINQHQRALAIFACVQNKANLHVFDGKLMVIPGAYDEGKLDGGSVFGSISGLLYHLMPNYLKNKYVVPDEVFGLHDHELKYRLIIRLAVQYSSLSYVATANPSTFLKLISIINSEMDVIADDIELGTFYLSSELPGHVLSAVSCLLGSNKERANELRSLKKGNNGYLYSDIWPNLKLIVTWTGGSCGIAISTLKELLSNKTEILELGYLASELRGTITFEDTGSSGVLTFHDNYYEFIEVDNYDNGERNAILLDKLELGKRYFIIITTPAGLYRYFMNDIIEVTSFRKNTPVIRFVQKGKGVTNITGEKLTEQQLILAVEDVNSEMNVSMPFYLALTEPKDSHYILYVEADLDVVDYSFRLEKKLQSLNTEYQSKRASGRLNPIMTKCLKSGTGHDYKDYGISKGQRESQFKYLLLQNKVDCNFPLENYVL